MPSRIHQRRVYKNYRKRFAPTGTQRIYKNIRWYRPSSKIHTFYRTALLSTVNSLAPGGFPTDAGYGMSFQLSDLPNYTEFTNLFDQFRICSVKLKWIPSMTGVDMSNVFDHSQINRFVTMAYDHNDATPPASEAEIMQYQGVRQKSHSRIWTYKVYPYVAQETYKTAITTGYSAKRMVWIDSTSPTIPHFGFKMWVPSLGLNATFQIAQVYATFKIQCKGTV